MRTMLRKLARTAAALSLAAAPALVATPEASALPACPPWVYSFSSLGYHYELGTVQEGDRTHVCFEVATTVANNTITIDSGGVTGRAPVVGAGQCAIDVVDLPELHLSVGADATSVCVGLNGTTLTFAVAAEPVVTLWTGGRNTLLDQVICAVLLGDPAPKCPYGQHAAPLA